MLKGFLLSFTIITFSVLFVSCSTIERPATAPSITHYQIVNVNVVDVINKVIKYNARVEVKQGRIVEVSTQDELIVTKQQATIKTIDGKGKYLIPGLWDNHSTLLTFAPEVDFPLYIANGVTSVRSNLSCPNEDEVSIYACMADKAKWKQAVEAETLVGPSIQGWGTFPINGKRKQHPDLPAFHGATTVEQTKKVVDHYALYPESERPFFLKTYNWLPKESHSALTQYAQEKGFEISGHLPRAMTIEEAVEAGQRSIAHARLFVYNCSYISDELRLAKGKDSKRKLPLTELYPLLVNNFDGQACQKKYEYMAKNDVFINPTLMTRRNDYYGVAGLFNKMQGLDYAHYIFFSEWEEDIAKHGDNLSDTDIKAFKDFYELTAKTIAQAQKAGVKILAGTDSWSEYNVPGFSLHEELQTLSDAGIDNFSVLQAASINGAEYFNISDQLGSINVGKQADMVLLDANPIDDIKNAQKIAMVFKGNQLYDLSKINELKSGVKGIAESHLFTGKIILQLLQNPTGF